MQTQTTRIAGDIVVLMMGRTVRFGEMQGGGSVLELGGSPEPLFLSSPHLAEGGCFIADFGCFERADLDRSLATLRMRLERHARGIEQRDNYRSAIRVHCDATIAPEPQHRWLFDLEDADHARAQWHSKTEQLLPHVAAAIAAAHRV